MRLSFHLKLKCDPFGTDAQVLTEYYRPVSPGCFKFSRRNPKASRVRHQNRKQKQIPSEILERRKARIFGGFQMKRTCLLMVVPALLAAMAFAQTPTASSDPDQTIKGCMAGSDGNYTVAEDGTGHIFKVTASNVDLQQHVGHDVTLIGHRGSAGAASTDAADNSFAVTELNMISEHCAVNAAVPTATVTTAADNAVPPPAASAPTSDTVAETEVVPAADAAAPAATAATAATTNTPAETAVTPAVDATPPTETNIAPAVDASTPAGAASTPAWDKSAADQTARVDSRRRSATTAAVATAPDVIASEAAETASEPAAAAASPAAPANPSPETAGTTDAAATNPAAPTRHSTALVLLIGFAILVILIGIMVPSLIRWRKRKSLEETGAPNLSFTREASSDQDKTDKEEPRKAA